MFSKTSQFLVVDNRVILFDDNYSKMNMETQPSKVKQFRAK